MVKWSLVIDGLSDVGTDVDSCHGIPAIQSGALCDGKALETDKSVESGGVEPHDHYPELSGEFTKQLSPQSAQ